MNYPHKVENVLDVAKAVAAVDHNMKIEAERGIYYSINIKYLEDYSQSQKEDLKNSLNLKLPAGLLVREEI